MAELTCNDLKHGDKLFVRLTAKTAVYATWNAELFVFEANGEMYDPDSVYSFNYTSIICI